MPFLLLRTFLTNESAGAHHTSGKDLVSKLNGFKERKYQRKLASNKTSEGTVFNPSLVLRLEHRTKQIPTEFYIIEVGETCTNEIGVSRCVF